MVERILFEVLMLEIMHLFLTLLIKLSRVSQPISRLMGIRSSSLDCGPQLPLPLWVRAVG
jgi:hypothetical protein